MYIAGNLRGVKVNGKEFEGQILDYGFFSIGVLDVKEQCNTIEHDETKSIFIYKRKDGHLVSTNSTPLVNGLTVDKVVEVLISLER